MAAELNRRKVVTSRGGRWDHSSVRNILRRLNDSLRSNSSDVISGSTSEFPVHVRYFGNRDRTIQEIDQVSLDWMVSVIGRAGFLATPNTLLYGLGGWTFGHFDVDQLAFGLGRIDSFDSDGPTVGGGIEQKLSPNWSLRAEYRYTNFGTERFSTHTQSKGTGGNSGANTSTEVDVNSGDSGTTVTSKTLADNSTSTTNSVTESASSQGFSVIDCSPERDACCQDHERARRREGAFLCEAPLVDEE